MVTDPSKGNVQDKVRLVLVYCLATTAPGSDVTEVVTQMADALETKGSATEPTNTSANRGLLSKEDCSQLEKGLKAIEHVKNLRSMQMIPNMSETVTSQTNLTSNDNHGSSSDMLSSFMARSMNQATGLFAKATERVSTMLGEDPQALCYPCGGEFV